MAYTDFENLNVGKLFMWLLYARDILKQLISYSLIFWLVLLGDDYYVSWTEEGQAEKFQVPWSRSHRVKTWKSTWTFCRQSVASHAT